MPPAMKDATTGCETAMRRCSILEGGSDMVGDVSCSSKLQVSKWEQLVIHRASAYATATAPAKRL